MRCTCPAPLCSPPTSPIPLLHLQRVYSSACRPVCRDLDSIELTGANVHEAVQQRLRLVQSRSGAQAPHAEDSGGGDWRAALAEAMVAERQSEAAAQQQQLGSGAGEDIDERGWLPK